MSTSALHRELGEPADTPVSFEMLSQLVAKGVREQADLDFKQTLYHSKNDRDKRELVKDVCAMANTGGGWIICGISENNSVAAEIVGVDLDVTSETDVHQLLERRIDPPLTVGIGVYQNKGKDTSLVAISVPNSPSKPHLIRMDDKAFAAPARKGASTVWLGERALREMYRSSFNLLDPVRDERNQRLEELSAKAAGTFPGIALALVLSPHEPLGGRLEKREVENLLPHLATDRFSISQGCSFLQGIGAPLSVGDRRYIGKQAANRFHAFIEVDFDGTIAIAIQLSAEEPTMTAQLRALYANQLDETTQSEAEYALIEAFNFASQLSTSLNPTSDSELEIRLIPHEDDAIIIRQNHGAWLGSFLRPREESIPIKQFRTISRTLPVKSSLVEEHEILTELVMEMLNQGGIEATRVLEPLQ